MTAAGYTDGGGVGGGGTSASVRRRVALDGIVQGVGFRPFVWSLAERLGLAGYVANNSRGVIVEVEGVEDGIIRFLEELRSAAPALAAIEKIEVSEISPIGEAGFRIADSDLTGQHQALISPDVATCSNCIDELFAPGNRRYRYAFTNCTDCGPRFTIVRGVPYDRSRTTMADFAMCADCAREYHDPRDRRFHAQPICCPACGPRLRLQDRRGAANNCDPVQGAVALMRAGKIVAVKGLGGYHLAVLASDENAVARLRALKHRDKKPFAVMIPDLDGAQQLAELIALEEQMLASSQRPIVLVRKRRDARIAESVAPRSRTVGLLLPYTPLHHLMCADLREPFVLTSGNLCEEPIAYRDDDAIERLCGIADAFLTHDRAIHIRTDDSVVRKYCGEARIIRRSRGYAPHPIALPREVRRPILACGAGLKNTFCVAKGRRAFISHHIGDLENYGTLQAFTEGIEHFRGLFGITPEVVAFDLHPGYLSTAYALERSGVRRIGVQHHHAHVASCMVENGRKDPVIGVAFDGLGYGLDGTLWGGEFLVADLANFQRVGSFREVPMPGGVGAIRHPWRMAMAYLDAAYGDDIDEDLAILARNRDQWRPVVAIAKHGINAPLTSSVGRLFDAVAAMIGMRDSASYEGQAAIELEQCAANHEFGSYPLVLKPTVPFRFSGSDLIRSVAEDLRSGVGVDLIAARFHNSVARLIVEGCQLVRERHNLSLVALSGGVFQNRYLLERAVAGLENAGFTVLIHSRIPANDGGISLGQAAIAAAREWLDVDAEAARANPSSLDKTR